MSERRNIKGIRQRSWSTAATYAIATAVFLFVSSALVLQADPAQAADAIARLTLVEGRVDVLRGGALPATAAKVHDTLFVKDIVRTKSGARAEVVFLDGTALKIAQRSRIDISQYVSGGAKGSRVIDLARGKVEAVVPARLAKEIGTSPEANSFEIHTPNAVAGVRGTDYMVLIENGTWILVNSGSVRSFHRLFADQKEIINAGQVAFVPLNEAARPATEATEADRLRFERGLSGGPVGSDIYEMGVYLAADLVSRTGQVLNVPSVIPPPPQTPPAFEVGRTDLSGSLLAGPAGQFDFISVNMKDVVFMAPSTGAAPVLWQTNDISGTYSFGPSLVNGVGSIPVSDGKGITGNFNITQWAGNTWSGSAGGQGTLSGGSYTGPVSFTGTVGGSHTGGSAGSFAGTGSGTASK